MRSAHRSSVLILIDTSAWIEFLRDTGSAVCERVDKLLGSKIATCDAVRMEVLAGARDQEHLEQLRRLLARATLLPTESIDFDTAAAVYRSCRYQGKPVHKLIDCLIAAVRNARERFGPTYGPRLHGHCFRYGPSHRQRVKALNAC